MQNLASSQALDGLRARRTWCARTDLCAGVLAWDGLLVEMLVYSQEFVLVRDGWAVKQGWRPTCLQRMVCSQGRGIGMLEGCGVLSVAEVLQ